MKSAKPSARFVRERLLHYQLLRGIYRLCRSGEWTLQYTRLHGNAQVCAAAGLVTESGIPLATSVGMLDKITSVITVDFRADVIATFMHECLHILMDARYSCTQHKTEEREVQRLERLMVRHLTPVQARRIHAHMATMFRGADEPPKKKRRGRRPAKKKRVVEVTWLSDE